MKERWIQILDISQTVLLILAILGMCIDFGIHHRYMWLSILWLILWGINLLCLGIQCLLKHIK